MAKTTQCYQCGQPPQPPPAPSLSLHVVIEFGPNGSPTIRVESACSNCRDVRTCDCYFCERRRAEKRLHRRLQYAQRTMTPEAYALLLVLIEDHEGGRLSISRGEFRALMHAATVIA